MISNSRCKNLVIYIKNKCLYWLSNKSLILLGVASLIFLTGCSSQPTPIPLTGTDRDNVLVYSEPATDNILSGLNNKDYPTFSSDFDDTMLKSIDAAGFSNLYDQLMNQYGKYLSRTVVAVQSLQGYYRVVYQGNFVKNNNVILLVVYNPTGDHKIAGLFFTQ